MNLKMEEEITIGIQLGNVTFSFKSDQNGSGIEKLLKAIRQIASSHEVLFDDLKLRDFKGPTTKPVERSDLRLASLTLEKPMLDRIRAAIRKVSYWDLVLVLLHYSPEPLTYKDLMALSKELDKPISYDWLNTEFHRSRYKGLVRSENIPGTQERAYFVTERGRNRTESFTAKLKTEAI